MHFLRQSTAVTVMLGPFLDDSDGKTAETGLSITCSDVKVSKNGGSFANKAEGTACTHSLNGWYTVNLNTVDTGTLGCFVVAIHKAGALPVWREFMVISANAYDSLCSSGKLQVDINKINGSTVSTSMAQLGVNVVNLGGSSVEQSGGVIRANAIQIEGSDATTQVQSAALAALTSYDPPTHTELTTALGNLNDISVSDILGATIEGSITLTAALRLFIAVLCGKSSGGGTSTNNFRDQADTKNRVSATVDSNGNRSNVTLDAS